MGVLRGLLRAVSSGSRPDELIGLSIDTTAVCDLRCTICSLDAHYADKGVMALETFDRLAEDLSGLRQLAFSSSAEPLANPDLPEMLTRAKRASSGLTTALTTNGTLLDEPTARDLIERGLDALEVSLDGASKATFEATRVGARFEQVLENVARLSNLKRALGTGRPHVSIRFVLERDNAHELEAMLDLALRLDVRHLVVNGLEPYDAEMAGRVLYGPRPDPALQRRFRALAERGEELGARVDLPALSPAPIDDCRLIESSCIVLWDGTVVPCSPLSYERPFHWLGERHEHPRISFGNVREQRLTEIWSSPGYSAWRRALREGRVHEECETCLKRAGVLCPLHHWRWLASRKRGLRARVRRTLARAVGAGGG